ncbi:hypothetical protein DFQ28_008349 [Apophysomyces sp. BC1034]|nr:hypothetical protein DFQ30_008072 [Apophysomyces sp. BC1015]KAG0182758.1 hypothetical protein DFQ29_002393 [Apophysomyces sp. BC1021]KAG0186081.1 hypothetical protein DFQ28_008349 [Apophysomyces sp. BC1034]
MSQLILGPHNGVCIQGKKPRRPKTKKLKLAQDQQLNATSPSHITDLVPSDDWSVEQINCSEYRITIRTVRHLTDFIRALMTPTIPKHITHVNGRQPKRYVVTLPYINFHGELYQKAALWEVSEWSPSPSMLPTLLDECVRYVMLCLNGSYPVLPRQELKQWYASLTNPTADPLALSIGLFYVRHVFIHHLPDAFQSVNHDSHVVSSIQAKLAQLTRDALADCFDEPHIHHIYALCLCNMTASLPIPQKVLYHTIAVRMANSLGITPLISSHPTTEIHNRLWWFLFQIDLFLHESGAISCSMLVQTDTETLLDYVRPAPCLLDEPDEAIAAYVWNNVLKLWLIRRQLLSTFERIDHSNEHEMSQLCADAVRHVDKWTHELPHHLKLENISVNDILDEAIYIIHMERCTNLSLLLYQYVGRPLTPWRRQAVDILIDCCNECVEARSTVLLLHKCNSWPGDLRRCAELLLACLQYDNPLLISKASSGLNQILEIVKSMAETRWQDEICIEMINNVEKALSNTARLDRAVGDHKREETSTKKRSIKMSNHMYKGVMMFNRNLQPRAKYYRPAGNDDILGNVTIFEDVARHSFH